jgi:hypothetical protein
MLIKTMEKKMNFNDLNEYLVYRNEKPNHNVEYIYKFDNGFGVSLVKTNDGYDVQTLQWDYDNSDFYVNVKPVDSIKSYTAPYVLLQFLETIKDK